MTSILCLLPYPLDHPASVDSGFDIFNHTGKLSLFVGGILLGVNFSFVWPHFISLEVRRVKNGMFSGLTLGLLTKLVLRTLCFGTSYCLV